MFMDIFLKLVLQDFEALAHWQHIFCLIEVGADDGALFGQGSRFCFLNDWFIGNGFALFKDLVLKPALIGCTHHFLTS